MSINLARALGETSARTPDAVAVTFEGRSITYSQLNAQAGAVAGSLTEKGVGPGDRVAVWMGNHPAFASTTYGAWRCGAVVVPVHAMLTEPEARHIFADSGAKVAFCGPAQLAVGEKLGEELDALQAVVPAEDLEEGGGPSVAEVDQTALALIAYTAGTSGVPKGAMLTHANLRANLDQMRDTPIAIQPDDVVLCILPLFHIFGLNVVLNLSIDVGARLVLHERFDAAESIDAIRSERVTVIAGAPPVYVAWLALSRTSSDAFAPVRLAVSGAAPLPKEALTGFRDRFGVTIWEGYGLTETSPALTWTAVGGVPKPGSIGRPLPGVELKLVDQDGLEVEEGDPGEVIVRGPNVFGGYWNAPEETGTALRDGWFHTGDVAVADDDGDLFVVDRRRDLILVSGFNVYPREVEDVLRRFPNVGDCAVVGDADEHSGERVRAIVVPDPPGSEISSDELIDFCRASLAPYKVPSVVEVVPEIPRNAAGKVLRRVLRRD